jgi:hypothetical protein
MLEAITIPTCRTATVAPAFDASRHPQPSSRHRLACAHRVSVRAHNWFRPPHPPRHVNFPLYDAPSGFSGPIEYLASAQLKNSLVRSGRVPLRALKQQSAFTRSPSRKVEASGVSMRQPMSWLPFHFNRACDVACWRIPVVALASPSDRNPPCAVEPERTAFDRLWNSNFCVDHNSRSHGRPARKKRSGFGREGGFSA